MWPVASVGKRQVSGALTQCSGVEAPRIPGRGQPPGGERLSPVVRLESSHEPRVVRYLCLVSSFYSLASCRIIGWKSFLRLELIEARCRSFPLFSSFSLEILGTLSLWSSAVPREVPFCNSFPVLFWSLSLELHVPLLCIRVFSLDPISRRYWISWVDLIFYFLSLFLFCSSL